jgi:hypothetical protein
MKIFRIEECIAAFVRPEQSFYVLQGFALYTRLQVGFKKSNKIVYGYLSGITAVDWKIVNKINKSFFARYKATVVSVIMFHCFEGCVYILLIM